MKCHSMRSCDAEGTDVPSNEELRMFHNELGIRIGSYDNERQRHQVDNQGQHADVDHERMKETRYSMQVLIDKWLSDGHRIIPFDLR